MKVPKDLPDEQTAMIRVNSVTAYRMLKDFVKLEKGDWVIQNAANSGVGYNVIQLCHAWGIKTFNVVRRKELIPLLQAQGADYVTDEEEFAALAKKVTGGERVKLALNAVGGKSASELSKVLSQHGTHVTYGAMGKEPVTISNRALIFDDIRFRGFWLHEVAKDQMDSMFADLFELLRQGKLKVPVEKMYSLNEASEAVQHAVTGARGGKILLRM